MRALETMPAILPMKMPTPVQKVCPLPRQQRNTHSVIGEIARSAANRGAGATRERHETASTEGNPCGDATSNGLQDEARLRQPAKKSDVRFLQ